jgi:hypothetical protein
MKTMKLTKYEMETIINFNEEEKIANIYTHNSALIRRLEKLSIERPDECSVAYNQGSHGASFDVPKKWIKINPTRILSNEELQKRREQAQRMRLA